MFAIFSQEGIRWTYEEFNQRVDTIAAGLISMGNMKGDRVGIYAPNINEWLLTAFACFRADLILVNVNPAFQTDELAFGLNKVGIKTLVLAESFKKSNYVKILKEIAPEIGQNGTNQLISKRFPDLKNIVLCSDRKETGMWNFKELYNLASQSDFDELHLREENQQPEDPVNIQFTSGTTGYPKGATLSH